MDGDYYHEDIHLPHNLQVEKTILGSLLKNDLLYNQVSFLKKEDFFEPFHGKLFHEIIRRINSDMTTDRITIVDFFNRHEVGMEYLDDVCSHYSQNPKGYAEVLRDIWKRRQISKIGKSLTKSASGDENFTTEVQKLEEKLHLIHEDFNEDGQISSIDEFSQNAFDEIENIITGEEELGPKSGFKVFDAYLGAFRKGELFILAGRPATGKTAFALNIAKNMAENKKFRCKVLFVSLEMSGKQIAHRINAILTGRNVADFINARLSKEELDEYRSQRSKFNGCPITVCDFSSLSISRLDQIVKKIKKNSGVDVLIIDYLQLIAADLKQKYENREVEIGRISRSLKMIAKKYDIPVIALSQLSRDIEKRRDSPRLSDLRGSGSIEQDADNIAILYNSNEEKPWEIELHLLKNRNGPISEVSLTFDPTTTEFKSRITP